MALELFVPLLRGGTKREVVETRQVFQVHMKTGRNQQWFDFGLTGLGVSKL